MAKNISAYADDQLALRVEQVAKLEQRPISQVATAALAFYMNFPMLAHRAIRRIETQGTPADMETLVRRIRQAFLSTQFRVAERALVAAMKVKDEDLERWKNATEDELFAEAVRATTKPRSKK